MRFRALLIVMLTGLVLMVHGFAAAHSELVQTEPEADSKVKELGAINLFFSEGVSAAKVRLLLDSNEVPVTTEIDESGAQVTATLNDDPEQGLYQVVWSATSEEDGHTASGSFSFEYDAPPTPSEIRAGAVLIAAALIAFFVMLGWQRRMAAIQAGPKVKS